jgi:hypothetical protein
MLTEIQGIHILLRRWSVNPNAPISEISPFSADRDKSRPFTREEIARAAAILRRLTPSKPYSSAAPFSDRVLILSSQANILRLCEHL